MVGTAGNSHHLTNQNWNPYKEFCGSGFTGSGIRVESSDRPATLQTSQDTLSVHPWTISGLHSDQNIHFQNRDFRHFGVCQVRNGPGWYIYPRGTLILSSGSSFMMYTHLPKKFWWSESEWTQPIQHSYGPSDYDITVYFKEGNHRTTTKLKSDFHWI